MDIVVQAKSSGYSGTGKSVDIVVQVDQWI